MKAKEYMFHVDLIHLETYYEDWYEEFPVLLTDEEFDELCNAQRKWMQTEEWINRHSDSDEEYFSTYDFNMYADDVDCEEYIWADDKYKTLDVALAKGKKAIGWLLYKVPKGAKKVEISYNAQFWVDNTEIKFVVK